MTCRYSARLILDGTLPRIQPDVVEIAEGRSDTGAWGWRVQARKRLMSLQETVKQELNCSESQSNETEQDDEVRGYGGAETSDWA